MEGLLMDRFLQQMARRKKWFLFFEIAFGLALFTVVTATTARFQHRTQLNHGQGWDGCAYYSTAGQLSEGKTPRGPSPFIYRLGTPAVATLLSSQGLLNGFLRANVLAAALLTVLMVIWLRQHVANRLIRVLLLSAFLLEWLGPARFTYFYPTTCDPWAMTFCLLALILVDRLQARISPIMLVFTCLTCLAGSLFREFELLVGLSALAAAGFLSCERGLRVHPPKLLLTLPFVSALVGLTVAHLYASPGPLITTEVGCLGTYPKDYTYIHTAVHWLYTQPLAMYIHAWLIAFGPILFLLLFDWRGSLGFLRGRQHLLFYLVGVMGLAWIGGYDTERYAFYAMPVIYVLCGRVIARNASIFKSPVLICSLAVTQLISARVLWTIPDYWQSTAPNALQLALDTPAPSYFMLIPFGRISVLNLLSHFGPMMSVSLAQYCVLGVALLAFMRHRENRLFPLAPPYAGGTAGKGTTRTGAAAMGSD